MHNTKIAFRLAAICAAALTPAVSRASDARDRQGSISIVVAKWAEFNLPALPIKLVTGDLRFRSPNLLSLGVSRVVVQDFRIIGLSGNSVEVEAQLAKHFGGEDHLEATLGMTLRTGELGLVGSSSANLAWTNGLSYAFSRPDFERGSSGMRGVDSRNLQYYMGIETELTPSSSSPVHLVLKVHHRSGVYGLISPRRTGSNYLGAGLRIDF